jgi:hypothetical protein
MVLRQILLGIEPEVLGSGQRRIPRRRQGTTEGRVRYDIGGGGELFIHWNSPLIESSFDNTFHIFAPPGWEVSHWGGQGHEAELEIRLRRTQRRNVPRFNAAGRGFRFDNNNWDPGLPVISRVTIVFMSNVDPRKLEAARSRALPP